MVLGLMLMTGTERVLYRTQFSEMEAGGLLGCVEESSVGGFLIAMLDKRSRGKVCLES
jgi:hypothetical protein